MNCSANGRIHFTSPTRPAARETQRRAPISARTAREAATSTKAPKASKATGAPRIDRMRVAPIAQGWALLVDDIDEPAWVVETKRQAVASARRDAAFHRCSLRIFSRAGRLQQEVDFGQGPPVMSAT